MHGKSVAPSMNKPLFTSLFDMDEIQQLQDAFSEVTGVASIITDPEGNPLTQFSNFSSLCQIIRSTEKGLSDCLRSDASIGSPKHKGIRMQPCLACGLMDGGASILVDGVHVGNWMIGQVLTEDTSEDEVLSYADKIGVDRDLFGQEIKKVTRLSSKRFEAICTYLSINAQLLSKYAYQTKALTEENQLRFNAEKKLIEVNHNLETMVSKRTHQLEELNCELEELNAILEEEVTEREKSEKMVKTLNEELERRVSLRSEQLSASENLYSATFNQSPVAMELYDEQGLLIKVNAACLKMFGVKAFADIEGQNIFDNENIDAEIKSRLLRRESVEYESDFDFSKVHYNTAHTGNRSFHWCITPVEQNSANTGYVVQIVDITERKAAIAQIVKAKEAAEDYVHVQKQFLANMSHEIRTPMNGIIGFAELALLTPYDEEQREALNIIKSSAHSLLRVVNDILDYSRIGAGKMSIQIQPLNIRELISEVLNLFSIGAMHKSITLRCVVDQRVPDSIMGDSIRLKQVLSNLIGNAVKFTHAGEVVVTADITPELGQIIFRITDTGIGISDTNMDNLFQGFYQADGSHTRAYGGTGLGLAISKSLVELMGGQVSVQSKIGFGSTFQFSIQHITSKENSFKRKEWSEVHPIVLQPSDGKRILLVEDDEVSRRLGVRLLEKMGYRVSTAVDGVDAIANAVTGKYDLILMDINMPKMDGLTATGEIRKQVRTHVPIVALTAQSLQGDMELCIASGMDDYLSKPLDLLELKYILNKFLKE